MGILTAIGSFFTGVGSFIINGIVKIGTAVAGWVKGLGAAKVAAGVTGIGATIAAGGSALVSAASKIFTLPNIVGVGAAVAAGFGIKKLCDWIKSKFDSKKQPQTMVEATVVSESQRRLNPALTVEYDEATTRAAEKRLDGCDDEVDSKYLESYLNRSHEIKGNNAAIEIAKRNPDFLAWLRDGKRFPSGMKSITINY